MKKIFTAVFSALFCAALMAADMYDVHLFPVDFQRGNFAVTESYPYRVVVKFQAEIWPLHKDNPQFVIELPAAVKLIRANTKRIVPVKDIEFTSENFVRDGKNFTRYTMTLPARELNYNPKVYNWRCGFDIYLEADKGSAGLVSQVNYHFIHKNEKLLARSFNLNVMPEIPAVGTPLKKFRLSVKEFPSAGHPDTKILARQLAMWNSFHPCLFMSWSWEQYRYAKDILDLLNKHAEFYSWSYACFHSTMIFNNSDTEDLGFSVNNKVTRPGVPLFHGPDGKVDPGAICPQYLIKDPEGLFFGDYLRRAIGKARKTSPSIKTFIVDYEPVAGGGTCDDCMKDFARFAKLKTVPSRDDIKPGKPLNRSWQYYKINQNKIIMNKIADSVRKHYPDMKVSFCSTELRPSADAVNTWDAVDVSAVEKKTDFYSFMIYSSGLDYYNYVSYAANHLTTAGSFPWIDPAEEDERFFVRYTPEKVRQNVVATIALNAIGIMFYPSDNLDGRHMTTLAETVNVLSKVEPVYYGRNLNKHVKVKVENTSSLNLFDEKGNLTVAEYPNLNEQVKVHLHEKDGVYLISALNYAAERAIVRIAIPEYKGQTVSGSDYFAKRNYTGLTADMVRNGFLVEIASGGTAVIKLSGTPEDFPAVTQETLKNELKTIAENNLRNNSIYRTASVGNAAIQWRSFKNSVMITLVNGENYVTINPGTNARVEEWVIGRGMPVGRPGGMLSEVMFYDPAQPEVREYTVSSVDLKGDMPSVTLRSQIKGDTDAGGDGNRLAGLILEKRIMLALNGELTITDTFINPTAKDIELGFRNKNIPYSVWKAGNPPSVTAGKQAMYPGVYLKKGTDLNWYAANNAKVLEDGTAGTIKTDRTVFTFDFPEAVGLYFWKNQVMHTAEALYAPRTLKAGEKCQVVSKFTHRYN